MWGDVVSQARDQIKACLTQQIAVGQISAGEQNLESKKEQGFVAKERKIDDEAFIRFKLSFYNA